MRSDPDSRVFARREESEISTARSELDALRRKAGYFIASRLQEEIFKRAGE
jgi:hypothetical protein